MRLANVSYANIQDLNGMFVSQFAAADEDRFQVEIAIEHDESARQPGSMRPRSVRPRIAEAECRHLAVLEGRR